MTRDELLQQVVRYYQARVLSIFLGESNKYEVWTDGFSGEVRIRDGKGVPRWRWMESAEDYHA